MCIRILRFWQKGSRKILKMFACDFLYGLRIITSLSLTFTKNGRVKTHYDKKLSQYRVQYAFEKIYQQ